MSSEQTGLGRFIDSDDATGDIRDYLSGIYGRVRNTLADIGFDTDWWGQSPAAADLSGDDELWVFQYVVAYSKGELGRRYAFDGQAGQRAATDGSPSPEVQFKTGIYVVGEPTPDLKQRLRSVDNGRLRTLFNTREYEGYMDGFMFSERREYVQSEQVTAREVQSKGYGLGVPWFEVEAYDEDGTLEGLADGYFNPFTTETYTEEWEYGDEPPEQEVWRIRTGLNTSRSAGGQWEIGPEAGTSASQRTREISGKDVYIGPYHIGEITSRGTTWLRREYDSGGPYADKATITSQSGIPPQALQKGAKLYKYRETEDSIYLSTTQPTTGFDPVDPDAVSPDQVGVETGSQEVTEILLDEDEPTQFVVETDQDEGRLLGLYDPPVVRDIERKSDFRAN